MIKLSSNPGFVQGIISRYSSEISQQAPMALLVLMQPKKQEESESRLARSVRNLHFIRQAVAENTIYNLNIQIGFAASLFHKAVREIHQGTARHLGMLEKISPPKNEERQSTGGIRPGAQESVIPVNPGYTPRYPTAQSRETGVPAEASRRTPINLVFPAGTAQPEPEARQSRHGNMDRHTAGRNKSQAGRADTAPAQTLPPPKTSEPRQTGNTPRGEAPKDSTASRRGNTDAEGAIFTRAYRLAELVNTLHSHRDRGALINLWKNADALPSEDGDAQARGIAGINNAKIVSIPRSPAIGTRRADKPFLPEQRFFPLQAKERGAQPVFQSQLFLRPPDSAALTDGQTRAETPPVIPGRQAQIGGLTTVSAIPGQLRADKNSGARIGPDAAVPDFLPVSRDFAAVGQDAPENRPREAAPTTSRQTRLAAENAQPARLNAQAHESAAGSRTRPPQGSDPVPAFMVLPRAAVIDSRPETSGQYTVADVRQASFDHLLQKAASYGLAPGKASAQDSGSARYAAMTGRYHPNIGNAHSPNSGNAVISTRTAEGTSRQYRQNTQWGNERARPAQSLPESPIYAGNVPGAVLVKPDDFVPRADLSVQNLTARTGRASTARANMPSRRSYESSPPGAAIVYRKEAQEQQEPPPVPPQIGNDIEFIKKTVGQTQTTTRTQTVNTAVNIPGPVTANAAQLEPAIARSLDRQVNAIADKVYGALERRLRSEQMRRGLL
ncbi:MAG: hypothetical protein FWH02_00030 [Oscillospiraceae bacterium]|nr:hypothetical protein [Oscillospiraceae bacterium]